MGRCKPICAGPTHIPRTPVVAFQGQQETGSIPTWEYPADESSWDTLDTELTRNPNLQSERSQGFRNLKAEVEGRYEETWTVGEGHRLELVEPGERQELIESQIWLHVAGVSNSALMQQVEALFSNPSGRSIPQGGFVRINEGLVTEDFGATEADIAQAIESRSNEFIDAIRRHNQAAVQQGSNLPPQPEVGLTPDGVQIAVPDTAIALQSIGFVDGLRSYLTSTGWIVDVERVSETTFNATASHEESGASIVVQEIPEVFSSPVQTRSTYMLESVLSVYNAQGYFANGEESIAANGFDHAARQAAEYVDKYVHDREAYNALRQENPNIIVEVEQFTESPEVFSQMSDARMDKYRETYSQEEIEQLESLETQRRNLQNGLETAVGNYRRQQNALQRMLAEAGITRTLNPPFNMRTGVAEAPPFDYVRNQIRRNVTNRTVETSMLKMVDSLMTQYKRLLLDWPQQLRRVDSEISDITGSQAADAAERWGERANMSAEDVAFAYLSQYLNRDEMSGILLSPGRSGAATQALDYRWDVDRNHPGHGLVLDVDAFDVASNDLTLESTLNQQQLEYLTHNQPDARTATSTLIDAEPVTVDALEQPEEVVRGAYTFVNNPFIRINAISRQLGDLERVIIAVEPQVAPASRSGARIHVELEIESGELDAEERIHRLPQLVEQFSLANYQILSDWTNPVARGKVKVVENTSVSTTYRLSNNLEATVIPYRRPLVTFRSGDTIIETRVDVEEITGTQWRARPSPQQASMLYYAEPTSNIHWHPRHIRYAALQKAVLDAMSDPEQTLLHEELRSAFMAQPVVEERAASNFARDVGGLDADSRTVMIGGRTHTFTMRRAIDPDADSPLGSPHLDVNKRIVIADVTHDMRYDAGRTRNQVASMRDQYDVAIAELKHEVQQAGRSWEDPEISERIQELEDRYLTPQSYPYDAEHITAAVGGGTDALGQRGAYRETYDLINRDGYLRAPDRGQTEADISANRGYVFFAQGTTYKAPGRYGYLLDAYSMVRDGIAQVYDGSSNQYITHQAGLEVLRSQGRGYALKEIVVRGAVDINKYLLGVIENGEVYVSDAALQRQERRMQRPFPPSHAQADLAGQPRDEEGMFGSSFIRSDGTTAHPVLSDILPVGAEDIHHPETRDFIRQQWQNFAEMFDSLSVNEQHQYLERYAQEWERAYLRKWDAASMSGMMTYIRQLAARSAFTAWIRKNNPDYQALVQYGASMDATRGDVSPHLAYVAEYMANVYPEDTVRVEDAGDGLLATFLGDKGSEVEYVETTPLRRAVFNQLIPGVDVEADTKGGAVDVLFTANSDKIPISTLINKVNRGGRLVIYGDSDWHNFSADIISRLEMYEDAAEYAASQPSAVDEATTALKVQLFAQWKGLGRRISGAIRFVDSGTRYGSETGSVIVVDNIDSEDIAVGTLDFGNQQQLETSNAYEISENHGFTTVRNSRYAGGRHLPREQMLAQREWAAEQKARKEAAKARADAAIGAAANEDKAQIYPNHPDIEMRVLGLAQRLQNEHIIPRGTQFNSIEELAFIADVARNPSMVTTQVLLVRDGEVHASVLGAVRSGEDVRPGEWDVTDMIPAAEAKGYDVIVVMNRPSGDTSIEENDKMLAGALQKHYDGFKYTLIRNGDTYSVVQPNQTPTEGDRFDIRENMPLIGESVANRANVEPPSWAAHINAGQANEMAAAIHSNFEQIHTEHIRLISEMVDTSDNWVAAAVFNQDGSLADMVSIPNAFAIASPQAAVDRILEMYGGADVFLFLASATQITDNPDFFTNTAWGQYLAGQPNIKGHYLVGGGASHASNRIKSYPITAQTPAEMRTIAKSVAPTASAELPANLRTLMMSDVEGVAWDQAKNFFVQTLGRDLTRTQSLTALEQTELRNQLNLAAASLVRSRGLSWKDTAGAAEVFKSLAQYFEKWHNKTLMDLNGPGLSVTAQHAYLMHYLAGVGVHEGEVVVIPDAGEGMLAAMPDWDTHTLMTEPDPTRRAQLAEVFGIQAANAPSMDLANAWQNDPDLSSLTPGVILLDGRSPDTFWQQLNQALHTVGENGRVVAHVNLEMSAEELELFQQQTSLNYEALKQYYQVRMFAQHDNRAVLVVDRVPAAELDPEAPVISKRYEDVEEMFTEAEVVRMTRLGAVVEEQPEVPTDAIITQDAAQEPAQDVAQAEAEEQRKHTKPKPIDFSKEETHREWVERVQTALGDRYDIGSADGAKTLYNNMMALARSVSRNNVDGTVRDEADIRADISAAWDALVGFTPGTGWEAFFQRLTAASMSMNYDPDMVYRLKLHELLDPHEPRDITSILDARTNEVDTLVSTSYRISHKKPVKIIW